MPGGVRGGAAALLRRLLVDDLPPIPGRAIGLRASDSAWVQTEIYRVCGRSLEQRLSQEEVPGARRMLEPILTRAFWCGVGGTLIREFVLVSRSATAEVRRADAVILINGDRREANWRERMPLKGEDIIVVQTKTGKLNMGLMGQALFSADLLRAFNPRSIRSVALCTADDSALHPVFDRYPGVEVRIMSIGEARDVNADCP